MHEIPIYKLNFQWKNRETRNPEHKKRKKEKFKRWTFSVEMILDGEFKPKTDEKDKHLTEGCQLERTHVEAYVHWNENVT